MGLDQLEKFPGRKINGIWLVSKDLEWKKENSKKQS